MIPGATLRFGHDSQTQVDVRSGSCTVAASPFPFRLPVEREPDPFYGPLYGGCLSGQRYARERRVADALDQLVTEADQLRFRLRSKLWAEREQRLAKGVIEACRHDEPLGRVEAARLRFASLMIAIAHRAILFAASHISLSIGVLTGSDVEAVERLAPEGAAAGLPRQRELST